MRADVGTGQRGDLGGRADVVGEEAGVDEQGVDAGGAEQPPGDLVVTERLAAAEVGVGVGVWLEAEQRRTVTKDGDAQHRVEGRARPAPGARPLVHQGLERRTVQVAPHQAVAVVVDERPCDVRRLVAHELSSAFSSDSDSFRASPGEASMTIATSSTHPNATTGNHWAGLASG